MPHPLRGTKKFLSTPSARRATKGERPDMSTKKISIHALREEGDSRSSEWWAT